ncbi:MAG: PAS domain-containing protein, partial [Candidatus Heimdallarchaeota archaeon]
MELEELLKRNDIPKDAKNEIQRCIDRIKKTEMKLKETEEKYQNLIQLSRKEVDESRINFRMIVEKMKEGVLLEDLEGNIAFMNPRTAELLGYSEDELIGKNWSFIVPEEHINQITVEAAKRPKGVSSTYEACALAKDGRHIPVIITATPIFNKSDEFKGVLSVFTDITKSKKAAEEVQESKERYQMLVEKLEEGVVLEDANGNVSFMNPRIVSMLGYTEDELLGKHWTNFAAEKY